MIDGSTAETMNMTDDIGTVLYTCWREKKGGGQTRYRFYVSQHNISFQSHLEKLEIYVWLAADANTSGTFNLRMPRIALAY